MKRFHAPPYKKTPPSSMVMGRQSRYGSPYRIGDWMDFGLGSGHTVEFVLDRKSSLLCYEIWLREKLKADPSFLDHALQFEHWGCPGCKEKPDGWSGDYCHVDIMMKYGRLRQAVLKLGSQSPAALRSEYHEALNAWHRAIGPSTEATTAA